MPALCSSARRRCPTRPDSADMRSRNYSEGYSGRGGQARSAYNLTVNPGGLAPAALSVSLPMPSFSIGTETDGSGGVSRALTHWQLNLQSSTLEQLLGYADDKQQSVLKSILFLIESAGATILNGIETANYASIVSSDALTWDYGGARGFPNESEYTVVRSPEDLMESNYNNNGSEGGRSWSRGNPVFYSGQDGFLASLATRGVKDRSAHAQALQFTQSSARAGIDVALFACSRRRNKLPGLLVPSDNFGQMYEIAAQANPW